MEWFLPFAGLCLVLIVLLDVFFTVLVVKKDVGVIVPWFSRSLWVLFRGIGSLTNRPRWWKMWCGPVMLAGVVLLWSTGVVIGFALIFWPAMGLAIVTHPGSVTNSFWEAVYYSGMCFTTLGVGDLYALVGFYRIASIIEAGLGFSLLTLTLTYLMGLYQAIQARNALALEVHAFTRETGDAAFLAAELMRPEGRSVADQFRPQLQQYFASHHQYPLIRYFRFVEPFYSSVRFMLVLQDALTLSRTVPHSEKLKATSGGSIEALQRVLGSVLSEVAESVAEESDAQGPVPEARRQHWRGRYVDACRVLREAGVSGCASDEAGEKAYVRERSVWEPRLRAIAKTFGEEWETVDVAPGAEPPDLLGKHAPG